MWKKILAVVIIVALVAGGLILHKKRVAALEKTPVAEAPPLAVHVSAVREGTARQAFPALGRVQASAQVALAPQISGRVIKLGPDEGQTVHKGQLLLKLDTAELEAKRDALKAKLAATAAALKQAQDELRREEALLKTGGSTQSAVEARRTKVATLRSTLQSLKAEIAALNVKIGYGELRAPQDARVVARLVDRGDLALAGHPAYKLSLLKGGEVQVPVPLAVFSQVKVGQPVILRNGAAEQAAEVTRIRDTLNAQSLGVLYIDLPQRPFDLPDGAPLPVQVVLQSAQGLTVPNSALFEKGGRTLLVVVDKGKAHFVPVAVTLRGDRQAVVAGAGLSAGQTVVVGHPSLIFRLKEGAPVVTVEEGA